jgi:hypothetical protein
MFKAKNYAAQIVVFISSNMLVACSIASYNTQMLIVFNTVISGTIIHYMQTHPTTKNNNICNSIPSFPISIHAASCYHDLCCVLDKIELLLCFPPTKAGAELPQI